MLVHIPIICNGGKCLLYLKSTFLTFLLSYKDICTTNYCLVQYFEQNLIRL